MDAIAPLKHQQLMRGNVHLDLKPEQIKRYSLRDFLLRLSGETNVGNFELLISDMIGAKLAERGVDPAGSNYIPWNQLEIPLTRQERLAYAPSATSTGGALVATDVQGVSLVEYLRNKLVASRLGVAYFSGLRNNLDLPKEQIAHPSYWVNISEGGVSVQDETQFTQPISLRPRLIGVRSAFTRSFLLTSSLDAEAYCRRAIANAIAEGIDQAMLFGSGIDGEPLGIANHPDVPVVSLGDNGGAISWDAVTQLENLVGLVNADINSLGYVTSSLGRRQMKRTQKASGNGYLWEADLAMIASDPASGVVNGYRAMATNSIPSNLEKGTGENLTGLIFGDFSSVAIGEFGSLDLSVNPFKPGSYESGTIYVRGLMACDIQVLRGSSFAVVKDMATS